MNARIEAAEKAIETFTKPGLVVTYRTMAEGVLRAADDVEASDATAARGALRDLTDELAHCRVDREKCPFCLEALAAARAVLSGNKEDAR